MYISSIKKGATIYVVPNVVTETPNYISVNNHVRIDKYIDVEVCDHVYDNVLFLYTDKLGERVLMSANQNDIYTDVEEVLQVVAGYLKKIQK